MGRRVGIDINSSWLEWFVENRPESGKYLRGRANGGLEYASGAAGGGPENTYYLSDYSGDLQSAVDAAKGKVLVVDESVTDHATLVGASYDYTKIFGIGRGVVTITGDSAAPVLDIRARGCEVRDLTIDGDNTSADCLKWGSIVGDSLTAVESRASNLELMNSTTNAFHLVDMMWYCSFDHIRMQTGHGGRGVYFDDVAGALGDNGQTLFSDCEISSGNTCISRNGIGGTRHRICFLRCGIILNNAVSYAADTYLMGNTGFINCDFEGASPTVAHLALRSYGAHAICCNFSVAAYGNACIEGLEIYGPYTTIGNEFGGTNASAVAFSCSGATCIFTGAENTNWTNWAGVHFNPDATARRGPRGIRYYSQSAQPTHDENGELVIWHDTDDNKIYLVARGNGGDKKVELT